MLHDGSFYPLWEGAHRIGVGHYNARVGVRPHNPLGMMQDIKWYEMTDCRLHIWYLCQPESWMMSDFIEQVEGTYGFMFRGAPL